MRAIALTTSRRFFPCEDFDDLHMNNFLICLLHVGRRLGSFSLQIPAMKIAAKSEQNPDHRNKNNLDYVSSFPSGRYNQCQPLSTLAQGQSPCRTGNTVIG
jgi:hypothetical protein